MILFMGAGEIDAIGPRDEFLYFGVKRSKMRYGIGLSNMEIAEDLSPASARCLAVGAPRIIEARR